MTVALGALVFVPLVGAVIALVVPQRTGTGVALLTAAGTCAAAVATVRAVLTGGPLRLPLGGWGAPLGVDLQADGLTAAMVAMTAAVLLLVTVYATGTRQLAGSRVGWPLWLLLWAGLNAVYVSADLFNTYVALEVMGLAAVSLVALGGRDALAPALRYLFVAVLGSLAYLLAVALVYGETGTLDVAEAGQRMTPGAVSSAVLALVAVGMALKTALFPLHAWLPPAHSAAPAAVSPVLSALVVKASFYVLVRVWSAVLPDSGGAAGPVLGVLGALAVVWGAALALRQERLKRVVAYSTVAQVGYLFLLFPLVAPGLAGAAPSAPAAAGWAGALTLAIGHGMAKSALFMSAGTLATAHGGDDLGRLKGAATRMPMSVMTIAVAGVSLAGLPPTIGFVGKWQLLQSSFAGGQWWWAVLLLGGTLLTVAYVGRMMASTFGEPGADEDLPPLRPVARRTEVVPLVLAVAAAVLGVAFVGVLDLLAVGAPVSGGR